MRQHLEDLLADPTGTLANLQRRFASRNCPAVAAATHRFLQSGVAAGAASGLTGGFICTPPTGRGRRIAPFVAAVSGGAVENCAVVGAFGSRDREHYFNLVKLTNGTYYVDAYTRPGVFDTNITGRVGWASSFEFFRDFVCRPAP